MFKLSIIDGKSLAVVLYAQEIHGKKEGGAVFFGIARVEGEHLHLERGEKGPTFHIPDDALGRLKKVEGDIKDILEGAEYWVWLSVEDLPAGEDVTKYISTGLKWPTGKSEAAQMRGKPGPC